METFNTFKLYINSKLVKQEKCQKELKDYVCDKVIFEAGNLKRRSKLVIKNIFKKCKINLKMTKI